MSEQAPFSPAPSPDVTSDDKLWAAIGYPIPIVPIIVLLMEEKKNRPFIRYHAVQSLLLNVALWAVYLVITVVTFGIASLCAPLVWLVTLWPAYEAYNGKLTELPVISKLMKNQGWV